MYAFSLPAGTDIQVLMGSDLESRQCYLFTLPFFKIEFNAAATGRIMGIPPQ